VDSFVATDLVKLNFRERGMKIVAIHDPTLTSLLTIKDKEAYIARMVENRKPVQFAMTANASEAASSNNSQQPQEESPQYVAIIPINGVMTRYGDMCSYGTEELGAWIKQCIANPEIAGIVLEGDTPGGEVNGVKAFSEIIRDSTKPIVGLVKGMVCSAGVYAFSGCAHIMMEPGEHSQCGSIGVLCVKETLKDDKISYEIIRSEGSERKARFNSIEELDEKERNKVNKRLKAIQVEFVETVKVNRKAKTGKDVPDEAMNGDVWGVEDSVKLNLVDSEGYIEDAVQLVFKLSQSSNS
jgi:protease-4